MPRVLVWNVEWSPPAGARADRIARIIEEESPDIVCFTEWRGGLHPAGGEVITSDADYGYRHNGDRRKVALWSRHGWSNVDALGHRAMPGGRFVAADTTLGDATVRVVGVCIPWHDAHVHSGRKDRSRWQDHESYLLALREYLHAQDSNLATLVVGDYNQRIPRHRQPQRVYELLLETFQGFEIVTAGSPDDPPSPRIDHTATRGGITASNVRTHLRKQDGIRLSDHDCVVVDLSVSQ